MVLPPTAAFAGGTHARVLRCVVVDDDPMSRQILENHIGQTPNMALVATFSDGLQLLDYVRTQPSVDVLFLDVQMPQLSGMEVLTLMPQRPAVVLTTQHREFAVEAFAQQVVDYLVKPVEYARFLQTVLRVQAGQASAAEGAPPPTAGAGQAGQAESRVAESLFLKHHGRLIRIPFASILYAEAVGQYAVLHTTEQQYSTNYPLRALAAQLPEVQFARVHRSYVVNLHMLEQVDDETNITLRGGRIVPIGRTYAKAFMATLQD